MRHLNDFAVSSKAEQDLLERCRDAIRDIDPSAEIILYGSRARGDAGQESDYDLLILIDSGATIEREDFFCRQLYPIELDTGTAITAFVYNRQQWNTALYRAMPFHKNVERDGVIL